MPDNFQKATEISILLAGDAFDAGALQTVDSGDFASDVADGRPTLSTEGVKLLGAHLVKVNADLLGSDGSDTCDVAIYLYDADCALTSKWQLAGRGVITDVTAGAGLTDKFFVSGYSRIAVVPITGVGGTSFEWSVQASKVS